MPTDNDMLRDIAQRLPAARRALAAATGDMPASGQHSGSQGVSDRTGRIALAVIDGTDTAWTDTRTLDTLIATMHTRCRQHQPIERQLIQVIDILDRWAPNPRRRRAIETNLKAASDDLLNKTEDVNNCRSCKRDPGSWGEPHRRGLCRSCIRYLDRIHTLYDVTLEVPPVQLVVVLRERGKVTDADIHNVMHGQRRRDA